MENVTLAVSPEWKTIVDSLVKVYSDRAAGASVLAGDALPIITAVLSSLTLLGPDAKTPDNIAYLTRTLAQTFIPQVKAA